MGSTSFFRTDAHILEEASAHLWNLAASPCQPHSAQISLFCCCAPHAPRTGSSGDQLSHSYLNTSVPGASASPCCYQPQHKGLQPCQGSFSWRQALLMRKPEFPFSFQIPNFQIPLQISKFFELVQAPGLVLAQHVQMNALSASPALQLLSHIQCTPVKVQPMLPGGHRHFQSFL